MLKKKKKMRDQEGMRGVKASKVVVPDEDAGDMEKIFIFLMFFCFLKKKKKHTFCLSSLLSRFSGALPASGFV